MDNVIDLKAWHETKQDKEHVPGELDALFKDLAEAEAALETLRTVIKEKLGL